MQKRIRACLISNIGHRRDNHEDNYLFFGKNYIPESYQSTMSQTKNRGIVDYLATPLHNTTFAIADGMGGQLSGEIASLYTVESLCRWQEKIFADGPNAVVSHFRDCIDEINGRIVKYGEENHESHNLGTTLVAMTICEGIVSIFSVGDSRIYRYNGKHFAQLTVDHTERQRLLDLELVDVDHVEQVDKWWALYRYLGKPLQYGSQMCDCDTVSSLGDKEWFLLCSDGLCDAVSNAEIEEIIRASYCADDLYGAANTLENRAFNGIQPTDDNFTVILVELS